MALKRIFGRPLLFCAASLWFVPSITALALQSNATSGAKPPAAQSSKTDSSHSGTGDEKQSDSETNAFPASQSKAAARTAAQQAIRQNQDSTAPPSAGSNSAPPKNFSTHAADGREKHSAQPGAAQANPFPQAQSEAAAKDEHKAHSAGNGPRVPPAPGFSSSDANLPPALLGDESLSPKPKLDSYTRDHTLDGRIEDNLKVADFYMKRGNYRGAQWRFQDTLKYDPHNETALYGVAEAMCKQNLTADAIARFKSYARSYPQGKYALKAERMLSHPNRCANNW